MRIAATDATLETEWCHNSGDTRVRACSALGQWAAEADSDVATQFEGAAEAAAERADRIDADAGDPDGFIDHLETVSGLHGASGPASSLPRWSPTGSICRW